MAATDTPSGVATVLIVAPIPSVLVHFACAVHVPTRVASGLSLAAHADSALHWLCVPVVIRRGVGLPTAVAWRTPDRGTLAG